MAKRRLRRARRQPEKKVQAVAEAAPVEKKKSGFEGFYEANYKKLLIVPFLLLVIALAQIGYQVATTGEFIQRGVSLKGGTTITIPTSESYDVLSLAGSLESVLGQDITVRELRTAGAQTAIVVESDATEKDATDQLIAEVASQTETDSGTYSVDVIGSSLGESFFREIAKALWAAFLFMGMVVFLYFGTGLSLKILTSTLSVISGFVLVLVNSWLSYVFAIVVTLVVLYIYLKNSVPSIAVMLAAVSDIIITIAILNIMQIKISTAGIAAFLMLIGYSIDTDILLSTRVIKRKEGTVFDRIYRSMKTGLTMSVTTLAAVLIVLVLSKSEVLTQIMTILLIGLIIDVINTWLQNAGILRWYMAKNE